MSKVKNEDVAASMLEVFRASPSLARWYTLGVLMLVYALNIADRYVVSTVLESIRLDLNLSDSAIGFLTGVALALFVRTDELANQP